MLQTAFDKYASSYDEHFTYSLIGRAQRKRVHHFLNSYLKKKSNILEVNCGTGEDAIWLSNKGHKVLATDLSPEMISTATKKDMYNKIRFKTLDANAIDTLNENFDLIFSNFGGLNCLNENELKLFLDKASQSLLHNGLLIMVFISSNCTIEKWYFKLKGKTLRRNETCSESFIENDKFTTYYYSPEKVEQLAHGKFNLLELKPIGLFIPPSYIENKIKKYPLLFKLLVSLESIFGKISWFANKADHYFIALKKT
jgi:ubiquinone/menaquinone biosynthesis C-methylase UbiE